jgi:hypothetical protein
LKKVGKTAETLRAESRDPFFEIGDYSFGRATGGATTSSRDFVEAYRARGVSFAPGLEALHGNPLFSPPSVIVLCDARTYSAAFHFLYYLRELGAVVVGVPPGQAPNAFMETTPFVLSESYLEGSISNSVQILLPEDPGARALRPEFELTYELLTTYDFAEDAALHHTLDLIAQGHLAEARSGHP